MLEKKEIFKEKNRRVMARSTRNGNEVKNLVSKGGKGEYQRSQFMNSRNGNDNDNNSSISSSNKTTTNNNQINFYPSYKLMTERNTATA